MSLLHHLKIMIVMGSLRIDGLGDDVEIQVRVVGLAVGGYL